MTDETEGDKNDEVLMIVENKSPGAGSGQTATRKRRGRHPRSDKAKEPGLTEPGIHREWKLIVLWIG